MKRFIIITLAVFLLTACQKRVIDVTDIRLDRTTANIRVGESLALNATVFPDNATDKSVVWSVGNSLVAKVDNGIVKALEQGSTTVSARAGLSSRATCEVLCYSGTVTVGTASYPVVSADGYESTSFDEYPGDIEISLHSVAPEGDRIIKLSCPGRLVGEKVDMNAVYPSPDSVNFTMWMISSFQDSNDDYTCVYYVFGTEGPRVVDNMWADKGASVAEGSYFKLCRLSNTTYSLDCDVKLTDGTHFASEWSGYAGIK